MIGEQIKHCRKALKMTQKELAKEANISRVSIGNYERGDRIPSVAVAKKIATALRISPLFLLQDEDPYTSKTAYELLLAYLLSVGCDFYEDIDLGSDSSRNFSANADCCTWVYNMDGCIQECMVSNELKERAFNHIIDYVNYEMQYLYKKSDIWDSKQKDETNGK